MPPSSWQLNMPGSVQGAHPTALGGVDHASVLQIGSLRLGKGSRSFKATELGSSEPAPTASPGNPHGELWAGELTGVLSPQNEWNSYNDELVYCLEEIEYTLKKLPEWVLDEPVEKTARTQQDECYIHSEPMGVVLIIGTWNYPFDLTIQPMVGAIAAGTTGLLQEGGCGGSVFLTGGGARAAQACERMGPGLRCSVMGLSFTGDTGTEFFSRAPGALKAQRPARLRCPRSSPPCPCAGRAALSYGVSGFHTSGLALLGPETSLPFVLPVFSHLTELTGLGWGRCGGAPALLPTTQSAEEEGRPWAASLGGQSVGWAP